jgi:hypothetical protein
MSVRPEPAAACCGFVHVVKCGGTAVRDALAGVPGSYSGPGYFDPDHFAEERFLAGMSGPERRRVVDGHELAEVVEAHQLVVGHYWARTLVSAGCATLAVQLREPRSRILSLYRYWESQSKTGDLEALGPWGSEVVGLAHRSTLKDFLASTDVRAAVDNVMARQLLTGMSGRPGWSGRSGVARRSVGSDRSAGSRSRGSSPWALRRSDLDCLLDVLVVADWSRNSDRFVARLCDQLGGVPVPDVELVNETQVTGATEVIDGRTLELLTRATALDSNLVDALTDAGALPARSAADLGREFEETAERLGFVFG